MTTITFWILMALTSVRSASLEAIALPPFQTQQECAATMQSLVQSRQNVPLNMHCYRMTMVIPEGSAQ